MRTVATCALLACLVVGVQPACGRTLDLRTAGETATSAAATHGQVERVDCWRATGAVRTRLRHAAFCVARVRTASSEGCFLFYELGFANKRGPAVKVTRSWKPWCASPQAHAAQASVAERPRSCARRRRSTARRARLQHGGQACERAADAGTDAVCGLVEVMAPLRRPV